MPLEVKAIGEFLTSAMSAEVFGLTIFQAGQSLQFCGKCQPLALQDRSEGVPRAGRLHVQPFQQFHKHSFTVFMSALLKSYTCSEKKHIHSARIQLSLSLSLSLNMHFKDVGFILNGKSP